MPDREGWRLLVHWVVIVAVWFVGPPFLLGLWAMLCYYCTL